MFLFIFSFLFSFIILSANVPVSFSESDVRTVTIFVEPPTNDNLPLQEQLEKNDDEQPPKQPPTISQELPSVFVTGNE